MTYGVRTQTIALDDHELRSIRRWLNEFATVNGKDIWLTRPPGDFTRPAYVIKETERMPMDRGRSMTVSDADWQIEILDIDFNQTRQTVAEIRQRLLQVLRIPLYLYGWQYPDIYLEELPGVGSLPAGEVSVGVTAVNNESEESLMSKTEQITVALNSAIRVSWTPWPRGVPVAKEYNVYAGALASETKEAGPIASPGSRVNVFQTITSLAGGGATPPSSSVFFANRYMRVDPSFTRSRTLEHPSADDVFNGFVNFRTMVESVRIAQPGLTKVEQPIVTVTKDVN